MRKTFDHRILYGQMDDGGQSCHAYIRSTYWLEMSMNDCALGSAVGVVYRAA